jgi:hypothetical protein
MKEDNTIPFVLVCTDMNINLTIYLLLTRDVIQTATMFNPLLCNRNSKIRSPICFKGDDKCCTKSLHNVLVVWLSGVIRRGTNRFWACDDKIKVSAFCQRTSIDGSNRIDFLPMISLIRRLGWDCDVFVKRLETGKEPGFE